ncbi:hypothetical protein ACR0ST_06745 [Aliidiomarina sp. Khilg15.8]
MKPQSRATRSQRGQVLVLLLVSLLGLWLGSNYVLSLSQVAQRQTHIQHVADHATEALAIVAARDLNYKAVTNRAMLANHIAMAQLAGLVSWFRMVNETTRNSALVTSWVPYLNAVMAQLSRAVQQMQQPFTQAVQLGLRAQQMLVQLISSSQLLFHAAAAVTALQSAEHIIERSDPSLQLVLLNHASLPDLAYTWLRFQRRERRNQEFVELLQQSRDGFTQRRSYTWLRLGRAVRVSLDKWGGSEAVSNGRQHLNWQAVDVATLRVRLGPFSAFTLPVGRGASHMGQRPPLGGPVPADAFGGSYRARNAVSRSAAAQSVYLGNRLPVPGHQRIAHADLPSITLLLRTRTDAGDAAPGWAAAKAQITYARPQSLWPRRDAHSEQANLFNALWRAELQPLSAAERWLLEQQI